MPAAGYSSPTIAMRRAWIFAAAVLLDGLAGSHARGEQPPAPPEQRAIDFLACETAAWPEVNHCFSCHNNGDAARALYAAVKRGYDVPADKLRETTDWLAKPADWRKAKIPAEFRDDRLSAIQFGAALVAAVEAGATPERKTLTVAAEMIAGEQDVDGSWHVDASGQAGSPVTYGAALATWSARRALLASGDERFRGAVVKADAWLREHEAHNTPDVAAALLALAGATDQAARTRREQSLDFLRQAQTDGGGWGPYRNSPPEIFDTALAVLALAAQPRTAETDRLIEAGRKYLLAEQLADGSWLETTRPSGSRSYAQRLSTTGWATLALLSSRLEPKR